MTDFTPGTIVISASSDRWNDFGERIFIEITIIGRRDIAASQEPVLFSGYFGFIENPSERQDTSYLREITGQRGQVPVLATEAPTFFTMLPDMASYRRLVQHLGQDEARHALQAMNDVVEADDQPGGKHWLRLAKQSRVFSVAFLRRTESYFTWKNAASILRGVENEQFGRMSNGLRIRFQLAGRPNEHDLSFRFHHTEHILPQRFAIVIGQNGVGKSQTLSQVINAALLGKTNLTDLDGQRPLLNRILGFYPSAVNSNTFPTDRRKRTRTWYRRFSMSGGRARQTTSDLLVQLARSPESIGDRRRFDIFLKSIAAIDGSEQLAVRAKAAGGRPIHIDALQRGSEQQLIDRYATISTHREPVRVINDRVFPLSSGELSFLRFAALASLYIENGTLLLFDEPETHLHPNFISQFVVLLDQLLEQTGSAAIIATHSVYFVREAFEDQIVVIRSDESHRISVETPTLKTFGADVGAISYFVFGEDQQSRLALAAERKIIDRSLSWEQIYREYNSKISLDLLGEIRTRIESSDPGVDSQ